MSSRRRREAQDEDIGSEDEDLQISESDSENEKSDTDPDTTLGKVSDNTDALVKKTEKLQVEEIPRRTRGKREKRGGEVYSGATRNKEIKKKSPAIVPRGSQFFLHDNRQDSKYNRSKDFVDREISQRPQRESKLDTESAWKHDKFDISLDDGPTVAHEYDGRTDKYKNRKNRRSNRSYDKAVLQEDSVSKSRAEVPEASKGSRPENTDSKDALPLYNKKKSVTEDAKLAPKSDHQHPESEDVSLISTEEPQPSNGARLKATAPVFSPSPGKQIHHDSTSHFMNGSHATAQRNYGRRKAVEGYPIDGSSFVPTYIATSSSRYNHSNDTVSYPMNDYDGSMYGYDTSHLLAGAYYSDNYNAYQSVGAVVDASGALIYGAGTPGQDGTVWFPTSTGGAVGPVTSPSVYNGTQYFPVPPAVYYDNPQAMGPNDNRNNYKSRYNRA